MKWITYAAAGGAGLLIGCALGRAGTGPLQRGRSPGPHDEPDSISRVEEEMRQQALARARSEVASGEYDMQG
jgi:hypothetical protein